MLDFSVFMVLHMRFSELVVKFKTLLPSFVSWYTFRGLSVVMFHWLLTYSFFSRVLRSG